MSKNKLGTVEAIFLVLSVLAPFVVTSLPRTILNEQKSSALLNIVYITIICLIICYLIYRFFKKFPGQDIIDVSNYLGGNVFKNIIGVIFILYFIISSSMLLRNFCEGLRAVDYPFTDIIYIALMFLIAISIANHLGFSSTIRTTTLVFPLLLISIVLLFVGNIENFSFERVFPILGDGFYNTFIFGLTNIGAFAGISYIYFLPPLLKNPDKFKEVSLLSSLFSGIFIFICVGTLLFMFAIFVNTNEIMPLFMASRYIEFGSFFQRFESLFLLIWTISFCCYLSISCKFSTYIFKKIFNLQSHLEISYIFVLLIFLITFLPKYYTITNLFETSIYRILTIAMIFLGLAILILSNLKNNSKNLKKKGGA